VADQRRQPGLGEADARVEPRLELVGERVDAGRGPPALGQGSHPGLCRLDVRASRRYAVQFVPPKGNELKVPLRGVRQGWFLVSRAATRWPPAMDPAAKAIAAGTLRRFGTLAWLRARAAHSQNRTTIVGDVATPLT
jgi:hypothetical protein